MVANTKIDRVALKNQQILGKAFLQFDFKGHLDVESATAAIESWKAYSAVTPKTNIIYNCLEMTGFDSAARKMWQSTMSELKPKTGCIWVISSNAFILGAAKTMGILSGYDIKTAKSLDGIKP